MNRCGKLFTSKRALIRHKRAVHTGRKYECPICKKSFSRYDNLQRHKRNLHENNKHVCPICETKFARDDNLRRHAMQVHKKEEGSREASKRKMPRKPVETKRKRVVEEQPAVPALTSPPPDDDAPTSPPAPSPPPDDDDAPTSPPAPSPPPDDEAPTSPPAPPPDDDDAPTSPPAPSPPPDDDDDEYDPDHILFGDDAEDPTWYPDAEEMEWGGVGEEERNVRRSHWHSIRTRHRVGNRVQDIYNFRLDAEATSSPDWTVKRLRAIFQAQRSRFKINMSYGFILRNIETGELKYYHSSLNNNRVFDNPSTISSMADLDAFLQQLQNEDVLSYARQHRPNTKWVVHSITNMTVYVNKLGFPIGRGRQWLPSYIKLNKGLTSLQCNRQNGAPYTDNLCVFRCIALARGASTKNLEKGTKTYFKQYARNQQPDQFKGITLDQLPDLEKMFKLNIFVYALFQEDEDDEGKKGSVTAELVRRSHRRYADTMNLNLYGQHFSFIHNMQLYSKTYSCSKCGTCFKRDGNMKRHELHCTETVKYEFPGGYYRPSPSIFDNLADEGINVPEELRYYPYRATFDIECMLRPELSDDGQCRNTRKLTLEARHELLSISVCSNIPHLTEPKCFVSSGDPFDVVSKFVTYLKSLSFASYSNLLEKFEAVFKEIDEVIAEQENHDPDSTTTKKRQLPLERLKSRLNEYLQELPVLGFNSGRYDLNVIKRYLYQVLLQEDVGNNIQFIIKKQGGYPCLKTPEFKFLDVSNFIAPGVSYANFLKAYGADQQKGFFPYEWMDSLDKLEATSLPPYSAFYSKLKASNITEADYEQCLKVWEDEDMTTFRDYLVYYNNLDVAPFLQALENMAKFYKERGVDSFKDGISVPGLTLKYLFKTVGDEATFALIDRHNHDLYTALKKNIVGGPSIVFNRYQERGKTCIRGGKPCETVIGFDANALYLHAVMQEMPTGDFVRRKEEDHFQPVRGGSRTGRLALEWLEWESSQRGIPIRHKFNHTEKRVGRRQLPVDGFHQRTVFQFHGCFWHGHTCQINHVNAVRGKPMRELRKETKDNADYIRDLGYTLVEMWECEWLKLKRQDPALLRFVNETCKVDHRGRMTTAEILESIRSGTLFGIVECDLAVPDRLHDHFEEMPPIFKHATVGLDDIGSHMREFAVNNQLLKQPRKSLIGSMRASQIMLGTPLLKWYLEHGLVVSRIYQVIQYTPKRCFREFGERVTEARRAGDRDPSQKLVGDTMKLIGNSAYGKTVTNKDKFVNLKVTNDDKAAELVNSRFFRRLDVIAEDMTYEVHLAKRSIKIDLPLQIGFMVYQYAKLRMLQFYYDFVDRFIDRSDFEYVQMDTDSAYMALSARTIDEVVRPEKQSEYDEAKCEWFPMEEKDLRTPGLFKVEWQGDGLVALNSKTYICFHQDDSGQPKISCKGLNKRRNKLSKTNYMNVLENKAPESGVNRGFRMVGGEMYVYEQRKDALSYLYVKRKVKADGISTTCLDI